MAAQQVQAIHVQGLEKSYKTLQVLRGVDFDGWQQTPSAWGSGCSRSCWPTGCAGSATGHLRDRPAPTVPLIYTVAWSRPYA
jgi:hypothetical protein